MHILQAAYLEKAKWRPLVIVAAALLLSLGIGTVWRTADSVIQREMKYWTVGAVNTPSSLGGLFNGNASGEAGEMVFLNNVRLLAGPKPTLYVVSGANGIQMLVVLEGPALIPEHLPTTVDIKGLIRRLPSLAVLRKEWKLSDDQIHIFEKQRIYIAAEHIEGQDQDATTD